MFDTLTIIFTLQAGGSVFDSKFSYNIIIGKHLHTRYNATQY